MSFWSWLTGSGPNHEGITPNANPGSSVGGDDWNPGDPDGFEVVDDGTGLEARAQLGFPQPSPHDGWPAEWSTQNWNNRLSQLVDTAWDCMDLNASVLSTMPVYRTVKGQITSPLTWMTNPDPLIYQSWQEFAKQLFWDFQLGEAFVMAMSYGFNGYPSSFRVIPPSLMHVEFRDGLRVYKFGGPQGRDVTDDILHIRYQSATNQARGTGPLAGAGARMVTIGLLQRYIDTLAQNGGRTLEWISSDQKLSPAEANELQREFVEAKKRQFAEPAVFGKGGKLEQAQQMSAREMALLEIAQWSESRICVKLRVPPYLMALPSGGDSMTYSNVSQLFDFHDRAGLRTFAASVMPALSNWVLPAGQAVELNRDEYSRPEFKERSEGYKNLIDARVMHPEEARVMERLSGPAPEAPNTDAATALSGGDQS